MTTRKSDAQDVNGIDVDLTRLLQLSNEDLFSLDPHVIEQLQFDGLRRRFCELRTKLGMVDRLANDLEISEIRELNDIVSLCLPHTMYKSYSETFVEKRRYDRMTQWLQTLTTHDLSKVDVSGCDGLESWLNIIEKETPLKPAVSSGTGGKISLFPRSRVEWPFFHQSYITVNDQFRDEPGSGLGSGKVPYFFPWPAASGRQSMPRMCELLREITFKDSPGMVHTLGKRHWNTDMLWLAARLRLAQSRGELHKLKLTPAQEKLRADLAEEEKAASSNVDRFLHELIVEHRGKRVFFFAPYGQMIALAEEAKKRDLRAEFSPDSYILGGGASGSKGSAYPEGWQQLIQEIFPYRYPYNEVYGMTELNGSARLCSKGYFHLPPWIILYILDPDTSKPHPRSGVQTGRLALFDLLALTYWGGIVTGDKVTVHWTSHCECGRTGPRLEKGISRFTAASGDDKITCAKTPDAYEEAVKFAIGSLQGFE